MMQLALEKTFMMSLINFKKTQTQFLKIEFFAYFIDKLDSLRYLKFRKTSDGKSE